jgi:hypothetical protein
MKAAIKGTAGGHANLDEHSGHGAHGQAAHAAIRVLSTGEEKDEMERIVAEAMKLMQDMLAKGDIQKFMEAQAKKKLSKPAQQKLKSATEVSARIDMSAEVVGKGLCPECKQPMIKATAGANPVWTCVKDRITLPIENGQA